MLHSSEKSRLLIADEVTVANRQEKSKKGKVILLTSGDVEVLSNN